MACLGHTQLGVRGVIALLQAGVSLVLALRGIDAPHMYPLAACQVVSSAAFFWQYKTAWNSMFVVRSVTSLIRCLSLVHVATCGRFWPPGCDARPWHEVDPRAPFRAIHVVAALRMLLNAASLLVQFFTTTRRVRRDKNHMQLLYRAQIRAFGVPIHLARAVLKIVLLTGGRFERSWLEIGANFLRALVLIPISAWSLHRQWSTPPALGRSSSCAAIELKTLIAEDEKDDSASVQT